MKIGYSTRASLIKRLKQHQTGSPDTLVLLAVSLGGRTEEAKLHKTFHNFRLHGEWLKYNDELEHHIKSKCLLLNKQVVIDMRINGMASSGVCLTTFALDEYIESPEIALELNDSSLITWFVDELFGTLDHAASKNS